MKTNRTSAPHRLPAGTFIVLTVIISISLISVSGFADPSARPVARVNGVTIYQSDLSLAIEASTARNLSSHSVNRIKPDHGSRPVDEKKVLEKLVNIELLYQESLKHRFHGLTAESDELYNTEARRAGGEDKLASALRCNDMSPEQFRKSIFRNLSIKHLLNEKVFKRIDVTEEEVRNYYDHNTEKFREPGTIRLKQIFIKAPPDPENPKWQQARDRAIEIYNQAIEGEDFVHLVRKHSEDPVSATAEGDLEPIQKDTSNGMMDTVIFTMKPGTITKPIPTRQGFQIFKIIEISQPSIKKFEDVEKRITALLRRKQAREMTYQLISDLREKANIEIIDDSTQDPAPDTRENPSEMGNP
jgi:parvulin-like peptidyl-prolyl isomerase